MNEAHRPVRTHWWLERGDAICVACHDAFHAEATVRCQDCDDVVCATCAVEAREEDGTVVVVCRACAEARG